LHKFAPGEPICKYLMSEEEYTKLLTADAEDNDDDVEINPKKDKDTKGGELMNKGENQSVVVPEPL